MKRIIRAIEREIKRTLWSEVHERHDGNHKEADRLCAQIKQLIELKKQVEAF
ncbi:MAG: hypothetical protein MIO92_03750 [Methanosarcinaceae archaeon]|nr:hypothetical protein [Methanosarcinaceae archaeon]